MLNLPPGRVGRVEFLISLSECLEYKAGISTCQGKNIAMQHFLFFDNLMKILFNDHIIYLIDQYFFA